MAVSRLFRCNKYKINVFLFFWGKRNRRPGPLAGNRAYVLVFNSRFRVVFGHHNK